MITIILPNGTKISGNKDEVVDVYKQIMTEHTAYGTPTPILPDDFSPYRWDKVI